MKHLINTRRLLKEAQTEFSRSSCHIEYGTELSYFNSTLEKLRTELLKLIEEELTNNEEEEEEEGGE